MRGHTLPWICIHCLLASLPSPTHRRWNLHSIEMIPNFIGFSIPHFSSSIAWGRRETLGLCAHLHSAFDVENWLFLLLPIGDKSWKIPISQFAIQYGALLALAFALSHTNTRTRHYSQDSKIQILCRVSDFNSRRSSACVLSLCKYWRMRWIMTKENFSDGLAGTNPREKDVTVCRMPVYVCMCLWRPTNNNNPQRPPIDANRADDGVADEGVWRRYLLATIEINDRNVPSETADQILNVI